MRGKSGVSYGQERAASLMMQILAEVFNSGVIPDPALNMFAISFTRVVFTPDLKLADCYFVPFRTSLNKDELLKILDVHKKHIRYVVTQKMGMKYSAEIRFVYDLGYENSLKVSNILGSSGVS